MPPSLPPPLPVLLLDAGNTLVFLDELAVAAASGTDVDPARITSALRPAIHRYEACLNEGASHEDGWDTYMHVLLREAGVAEPMIPGALGRVRAAHDEQNLWRRVGDGVPEALDTFRSLGIRLGVVSNSEGSIEALLNQVGLADRFETIVDSAVVGYRKPDPRIFELALDRLNAKASEAMYVGDVPKVDVVGARAAGLEAVLIDAFGLYPTYEDAPRIRRLDELASFWSRGDSPRDVGV